MSKNDLLTRMNDLESQVKMLQRELSGILDHPKTDLLPLLPSVVTSDNHLTLTLSGTTLSVSQRGRVLGSVVLQKEG